MASDRIIYYDDEFIRKFEELKDCISAGDKRELHRFLMDSFGFIYKTFQYYAKQAAEGRVQDFEDADEEIRRELMRPLSYRQFQMVDLSRSQYDDDDVIRSIWDFLHDCGRIYEKKVMNSAELSSFPLILLQVYCALAREQE